MAKMNQISGGFIGELSAKFLEELEAWIDRSSNFENVIRALTQGQLKLEYLQILADGSIRYNDPSKMTTLPVPESDPTDRCVEIEEDVTVPEVTEKSNGSPKHIAELLS
jgi:hypothetical protein